MEGRITFGLPGHLAARGFHFSKPGKFEGSAELVEIEYQPFRFLRTGTVRISLHAKQVFLRLGNLSLGPDLAGLQLDSVRGLAEIDTGGRVKLDYFYSGNDDILIYASGWMAREQLNLVFACFLKEALWKKLPEFILQHLFVPEGSPLKQIRFKAEGTWEEPHFSLSSDLVSIEIRSRNPL